MALATDSDQTTLISIGEVARRTGRSASAIRYYEELGLISSQGRIGGRRHYDPEVTRTLNVVDTAQRAGLCLAEVRMLLEGSGEEESTERLREVARRKLPEVIGLIERAQLVCEWLREAANCGCPSLDGCRLFDGPGELPERPPGTPLIERSSSLPAPTSHEPTRAGSGARGERPSPRSSRPCATLSSPLDPRRSLSTRRATRA